MPDRHNLSWSTSEILSIYGSTFVFIPGIKGNVIMKNSERNKICFAFMYHIVLWSVLDAHVSTNLRRGKGVKVVRKIKNHGFWDRFQQGFSRRLQMLPLLVPRTCFPAARSNYKPTRSQLQANYKPILEAN